ncbi:hypothetical protein BDV59DRAFT_24395 [Aspergillus ambiguus]|uniref:uncharacterized protein n=1 Tax=Aspergillus ambiguus TaxID=176160 RepID=UPI003CCDB1E5
MAAARENPTPTLVPINLHHPGEYVELQGQRRTCGWDYTDRALLNWRQKQEAGLKSFFWIAIPGDDEAASVIRAGHISLDAYADPPDPELAQADRSILTIQTFFIRPEFRALGLGRAAMDMAEAMAGREPYGSPRCKYVAVTTMSKRYFYDATAGVEGTGLWESLGTEMPRVRAVDWYERRGYVRWKSEARWADVARDGTEIKLVADFLRKPLGTL